MQHSILFWQIRKHVIKLRITHNRFNRQHHYKTSNIEAGVWDAISKSKGNTISRIQDITFGPHPQWLRICVCCFFVFFFPFNNFYGHGLDYHVRDWNHLINGIKFVGFVVTSMPLCVVIIDILSSMGGIFTTDHHHKRSEDCQACDGQVDPNPEVIASLLHCVSPDQI